MTHEKMTKLIQAGVVAGTALLVVLLSVMIYGFVKIGVLNRRERRLEEEIYRLEQQKSESEADLAWAEGPGKLWLAFEKGWIKSEDK